MRKKKETEPSKEQNELCKLLKEWNGIVDDPKKKDQAEKIFNKIWEIKRGNIRPF